MTTLVSRPARSPRACCPPLGGRAAGIRRAPAERLSLDAAMRLALEHNRQLQRRGCRLRRPTTIAGRRAHAAAADLRDRDQGVAAAHAGRLRVSAGRVRRLPGDRADSRRRHDRQRAAAADRTTCRRRSRSRSRSSSGSGWASRARRPAASSSASASRRRGSRSSTRSSGSTSRSCRPRARWRARDEADLRSIASSSARWRCASPSASRCRPTRWTCSSASRRRSCRGRRRANTLASQKEQLNQLLGRDVAHRVRGRGGARGCRRSTSKLEAAQRAGAGEPARRARGAADAQAGGDRPPHRARPTGSRTSASRSPTRPT